MEGFAELEIILFGMKLEILVDCHALAMPTVAKAEAAILKETIFCS